MSLYVLIQKGLENLSQRKNEYRVAQFNYYPSGDFLVTVPDPDITFSYEQRIIFHILKKKEGKLLNESLRAVPGPFNETEKNRLRRLRRAVQNDGMSEFLVDFVPRYSVESVLRELN